jgi:hypothetical protein
MSYIEYPSGKGGMSYHKVERFRQGIVFSFVSVGLVFRFDIAQLVLRLAVSIALVSMARIVTEVVGAKLFLDKNTIKMLQNKSIEVVTETSEFAELGMKAAIAATQFARFDPDGNNKLDLCDIANVFASCEGVSPKAAYVIADAVMTGADADFNVYQSKLSKLKEACGIKFCKKPKKVRTGDPANQGLDFAEFVSCLEGDTLNWNTYVSGLELPKNTNKEMLANIEKHFAKVRGTKMTDVEA